MMSDSNDDSEEENYVLSLEDRDVISSTMELLWKTARSENITARQLEVVSRLLQVFEALPAVTTDLDLQVAVTGPRRKFGPHEIYHFWEIEVSDGALCVTAAGHFYRRETGGDTFTTMIWRAAPGFATEHNDYLHLHLLVDDAQPFDLEVKAIDFAAEHYSITAFADGEEIEAGDTGECEDDDEDNESSAGDQFDQLTLEQAARMLESAGADCTWEPGETPALHMIDCNECSYTDATLKALASVPSLHTLDVRETGLSDRSLVFLKHLDSLEWLCLRDTAVTDEGLQYLQGLTSLRHLDLVGTKVAGPGLIHLKGLVRLKELLIDGFQYHDQWLNMLRRDLPNCEIHFI